MPVTVDPTTGRELARHAEASAAEIAAALAGAARAQSEWRTRGVAQRADALQPLAAALRARSAELALLMAREMGKPVAQGRAEVEKCAWATEELVALAPRALALEPVSTDASRSSVAFEPLGVILAVMPWNFPAWQVVRAAVPALLAGNGLLLKHASNVTGCSLLLGEIFGSIGLPRGLFAAPVATHAHVAWLLEQEAVQGLTLTGSTEAGRALAPLAARALKKCVLELGGSDPSVVLDDADVELAVGACAASRLQNAGQSCIASKRFVVTPGVRAAFTQALVEALRSKRMGNPREEGIDVGPMARHDLRDALAKQVTDSVAAGAKLLLGGTIPDGPGAFYRPTVLDDVRPGMAAFDEETFGPVAAIVPARDEDDAIALANATPFGLGASVYTRDAARGETIARERLSAGAVFVNAMVKSDPRLPFGGIRASGFGRELGTAGLREFVNVKTVWVR